MLLVGKEASDDLGPFYIVALSSPSGASRCPTYNQQMRKMEGRRRHMPTSQSSQPERDTRHSSRIPLARILVIAHFDGKEAGKHSLGLLSS